jgi:RNA-binding protein
LLVTFTGDFLGRLACDTDNKGMTAIQLTPAQRKEHRSEAHHLDPVVMIGNDGLTPSVQKEVDQALKAHGLIKVRVFSDDRSHREAIFATLSHDLGAAPIQHIGKLLVLWRPMPPKEKVKDEDRQPGPRVVKVVSFSKSGNHRATVKKVKVFGNERVTAGGQIKRVKKRLISAKRKAQG